MVRICSCWASRRLASADCMLWPNSPPAVNMLPAEESMVLNDCATAAVSWPSAALPARMSSPPLEDLPTPAAATPRLAPPAAMFTTAPVRAQANFWMAPVSILSACCSIRSTICNPCAWIMLRLVRRCSAASLRITEANMAAGLGRATQPDRSPELSPGDARSGSWLRTSLTAAVKSLPA